MSEILTQVKDLAELGRQRLHQKDQVEVLGGPEVLPGLAEQQVAGAAADRDLLAIVAREARVVPLVGGKGTTCLRDIYSLLSSKDHHLGLVSSIDFDKPPFSDVKSLLDEISVVTRGLSPLYKGMGFKIYGFDLDRYGEQAYFPESVKEMLFHFLTTDARLFACNPEKSVSRNDAATGPISLLVRDSSYLEKVSAAFHSAFSLEVTPNYFAGGDVPLCLGPTPAAPKDMAAPQISEYMYNLLSGYPLAHLQGDGMRSF